MNRKYNTQDFFDATQNLGAAFENISLTTDIITGFPGETEQDFNETIEFIKHVGFTRLHTFSYSPRKKTRAANFANQIAAPIKKQRMQRLLALSEELYTHYINLLVNKKFYVLIEERLDQNFYTGYTQNYIKLVIQVPDNLANANLINQIMPVKIISVKKDFVAAEITV